MYNLLNDKEKEILIKKKLNKNQILFKEDEICEYAGLLLNGQLVIKSFFSDGKEIVYNTINKGEVFGNNLLFSDDKKYRGDVIATTDSELYLINEDNLLFLFQNNKDFLKAYLHSNANSVKKLNYNLKILSFDNAKQRLMYALDQNDGVLNFNSITSLALSLGLSREALSRLISKLLKENKIYKSARQIKRVKHLP